MTGAEILAQVREALRRAEEALVSEYQPTLDALDGCVLLTAAEAEKVAHVIQRYVASTHFHQEATEPALALLTPEQR